MASDYYKLAGTTNRHTDWTTEVVLEADESGKPTKVASTVVPVQLTADDRKKLEELGYTVEASSKSEADEVTESRSASGGDIVGAAPVFGDSEAPNQALSNDQSGEPKGDAGKSK